MHNNLKQQVAESLAATKHDVLLTKIEQHIEQTEERHAMYDGSNLIFDMDFMAVRTELINACTVFEERGKTSNPLYQQHKVALEILDSVWKYSLKLYDQNKLLKSFKSNG